MLNRLARAFVLASLVTVVPAAPRVAQAQPAGGTAGGKGGAPGGKGDKGGDKGGKGGTAGGKADGKGGKADGKGGKGGKDAPVEVDLDEGAKKPEDTGPVVAGQMTEEAATATRLFESEKWAEAALALNRVYRGETGDDDGNKQIAQYSLAVALYRLQYFQYAYTIFSEIADKPNHLKFNETLLWLAKLATQLPEPADIVERVGKYSAEQVGRFNNNNQRDLFWQLNYLLGRYKYRNRQYEEAIQLFEKVDKKSKFHVQSQFFNGISYVQLKKSVPAVQAFQRIVQSIDDGGVEGIEDEQRMRDLAYLSMARTYYSASVRLDDNNNPTIDEKKLSAAVKYWNRIDTASEYWLDGLFEESWAYFMAGDYPRALGNIHTIQAPYFPNSFYPEADILKAQIYFATCQYGYATTTVAGFKLKYEPIQKQIQGLVTRIEKPEDAFKFLQEVVSKKADLPAETKHIIELALSDRQLLKHIEYVKVINDEESRFAKAPDSFKESPLGHDVKDALENTKTLAVENGGNLVKERYQRNLDELGEHLRDAAKILIDITSAERAKLDAAVDTGKFLSQEDAKIYGVVNPDEEHILWPFDGEYWRDELGFYRQVVVSKCGRLQRMKRFWQMIAGAAFASSATGVALAADPPASGGQTPVAGICVSDEAKQNLEKCPEGVKQFTPKDNKPAGVKLGQIIQNDKKPSENKPGQADSNLATAQRDVRRAAMAAKAAKLLISEITQLEELWKATSKNAADRVQLARRLAETYVELENAAFREMTEADIKKDQPAVDKAKKTLDTARGNAIKYYRVVTTEYKTYPQLDEVLYYLAYEYEQAKNFDEARKVYLQLISDTPQSKYIPNAYLAFGELFFAEGQTDPSKFELAKQSYLKVLEYDEKSNKVWGYAKYKLGYVFWNLGERENFGKALGAFKETIEYGDRHSTESGVSALQKNARKDIIPVYALVGKPGEAYGFFKPLSGDKSSDRATYDMMDALGENYLDTGHYPEAIALYEDLLQRDKGDNNCKYQAHIVQATMAMKGGGNKSAIRGKLDDLVKRAKSFKGESHSDESKVKCANSTVELLYETAASWQIEAQGSGGVRGTNDKNTMKLAAEVYNLITENYTKDDFTKFEFPKIVKDDWPSLFKIKYAKADLLYFQGDWEKCGPAFDSVVEEDPQGPDAAEAAYASVLCYQKLYDQTHTGDKARKGTGNLPGQDDKKKKDAKNEKDELKKKEMTPTQKGMVQAFNRYVCYIKPSENDAKAKEQYVEVKYARARTYFESHYWEEAAQGFRDIAINHADLDSGIYAAQLYLEAVNILGGSADPPRPACYDDMATAVPEFIKLYCDGGKASKNQEQCTLLTKIQCDIQRLKAQKTVELANKGGGNALRLYEEGANTYLGIWKKYGEGPMEANQKPQCDRIDEVLFNAAEAFQSARLVMKSIQTRLILLNPKYGMDKSELAKKSIYKIGGNFQAIAVYDEAAKWYEKYSKEFPKAEKADTALSDAVVLRLGLGQDTEAIKDADDFMKAYGTSKPVETARVAFAIGAHYVEREDWDNARKRLTGAMGMIDKNASLDVQVQAHSLLGRVYVRIKSVASADTEYGKVRGLWKDGKASSDKILAGDPDANIRKLTKALTAVGEAYFYFAEKEKKKVDAIRFPEFKGQDTKEEVLKHIKTKVAEWMKKKATAIKAAEDEYIKVVKLEPAPPPVWVIAAGARTGAMWGTFVREFRAAPIPASFKRDDELRGTYYSALDEASEPQKLKAKAAYEVCLGYSVKYQYFDEYSRSCEEWLSKSYKNEYHQVDEFRGAPNRVNSGLSDRAFPLDLENKPINTNPQQAEPEKNEKPEQANPDDAKGKGDKKGKK